MAPALRSTAEAFRRLAQACLDVAASLEQAETDPRPVATAKATRGAISLPQLDANAARALDVVPEREGLTKGETKILTALAQAGRALSTSQIGTRCGLSSGSGSFAQSIAALRADGYVSGPGSAVAITDDGLEALGQFPHLPEGSQLFDYWCHKVGGAGGKILSALRRRHRERGGPMSAAELGTATGLSHGSGSFAQALAKLRRLDLVEGPGSGVVLSAEMQRACEVTIGVYDRQSGQTVKVDRGGKVVR